MMEMFLPPQLYATIASLVALCALIYVAAKYLASASLVNDLQKTVFYSWDSYINSLSENLTRLRSLRAGLSQIRPRKTEKRLQAVCDHLYAQVQQEIKELEGDLDRMEGSRDRDWARLTIDYTPGLDFADDFYQLIELARKGLRQDDLEDVQSRVTQIVARNAEKRVGDLEGEKRKLQNRIRDLEIEAEKGGKSGDLDIVEEAIAARLMADLSDTLNYEDSDAFLSAAEGQVQHIQNQLAEAEMENRAELEGQLEWARQKKRWFKMLKRLRKQALLLDEATGKASEVEGEDTNSDMERIAEFQAVEARNAEMQQRIRALQSENSQLSAMLEQSGSEGATVEQLRETLAQVDRARKSGEREMRSLEEMLEQMEDDLTELRVRAHRNAELEQELAQVNTQAEELQKKMEEAEAKAMQVDIKASRENSQLKSEVDQLQKQLEELEKQKAKPNTDGMVPEEEVVELQNAYDSVNSDLLKIRSALKTAEAKNDKLEADVARIDKERQEVSARYMEVREELRSVAGKRPQPTTVPRHEEESKPAS